MNIETEKPALLLIDIQYGLDDWDFYGGNRNNLQTEENAARFLQRWRVLKLPIYHIRHSSQNPESPLHASKPGFAIKKEVLPITGEPVISKNVNSAFIGTNLENLLKEAGISVVVILGLTTNHCISTSVRMASNLGFKTYLISDATATFDRMGLNGEKFDAELIHQTTLASLNEEFATVLETDSFLSSL
ncbi:cysteine hydrolase family protein [Croceitalea rosinachiae]|uniref:Cysteine hydrolase family protein n=1 Tax=Croceitalea rosinachiae TaxID=3075596 RepID=A0ABU3AAA3_9FLAO|nr:cysteine hydrolase family protein [Croceitalea sp. F388]MDT0607117.1 cysteine hydrolase family protein [Croceitalea sp. F388]